MDFSKFRAILAPAYVVRTDELMRDVKWKKCFVLFAVRIRIAIFDVSDFSFLMQGHA